MANVGGFYQRPQEGLYDTVKRKFNENLTWSGDTTAPAIGASTAAPAPATSAAVAKPFEAPGETVNPFAIGAPSRGAAMSHPRVEAPVRRSASVITPGLRAGAEEQAYNIGSRPDFSGNHSIADIEGGVRAKQFLEGAHQADLAEIDANDPYERARASERQSDADRLFSEDTSLVDAEADPGIKLVNGVYRTSRKSPRQSGAERKRSLETQRTAGYGFDRARAAEQEKAATENARRSSFLRATTSGLDQEFEAKAQELQTTLKGDQLRMALQKLNEQKRAAYNDAVTNAYQIGAKFDLR